MFTTTLVDAAAGWLERRTSRRSFLQRVAIVGSAMSVSGLDYVLRPGTAYASVCGSGSTCASGWTALCCTVNHGVNQCPPGSFAAGWWKADGASLCGGAARYYIDCQARCTKCGCARGTHFCATKCWNCTPHCAHTGSCDERRVCHNVFRYGQCHQEIKCSGPVWCRVISCTPPWHWEKCSTSSATDNFTRSHNAPCNATSWTAMQARYKHMGSQGSVLGASAGPERDGVHGRVQKFVHGRMYHSAATSTHFVVAPIVAKYYALGDTGAILGLPISDTLHNADNVGHHNDFQHGAIYASPTTGTHMVYGSVFTKWRSSGRITGVLGYPIHDTAREADGVGWHSDFQHGGISSSSAGTFLVQAPLWGKWRAASGPGGPLGYPITDTVLNADQVGRHNDFEHGAIYSAPDPGTHTVWGPIFDSWVTDYSRETGRLGYPVSDVYAVDEDHDRCDFQGGSLVLNKVSGEVTFQKN